MFCNRCGAQLQPDYVACPKCGRILGTPGSGARRGLDGHVRTLSILWMIIGGLFLLPAVWLLLFGSGARFMIHSREPFAPLFPLFITLAGGTLVILAAGGICVGLGLQQRLAWARLAAIVLGVLALFHPPLGTALGVYTLWVLLPDDHGAQYRSMSQPN